MVLVKAWDETFSQTVHQRFSYRYSEIVWGGRFTPAFGVDEKGELQVHVDKVGNLRYRELSSTALSSAEVSANRISPSCCWRGWLFPPVPQASFARIP